MSTSPATPRAAEALARLRAGNLRFLHSVRSDVTLASSFRRESLLAGQSPFAIVLACSDSRAPAELVFDCGLGELFVVRVAGNIVAPSLVGSIEFAASTFGTELVVVMGHTRCGAIAATLSALRQGIQAPTDNIRDIVDRIAPSIAELAALELDDSTRLRAATRANIRASVSHLRHASRLIEQRVADGRLVVIGAEYALESGEVDFFDLPAGPSESHTALRAVLDEGHPSAAPLPQE
jgi:carbonic anhydrase